MSKDDLVKKVTIVFMAIVAFFFLLLATEQKKENNRLQERLVACEISEASYKEKYEAYRDTFVRFRANHPESGDEVIIVEKSKD